ncbi:SH3 domain-containing protein [Clostridium sp. LY3-2]|uniref:SH3 domain-containing protein n=1 Tax=Clostridium sp. LY3-2 TaxID=2942482 RepID=UPI002152D10B|nr:SH3 domain-containing protein [Clostridium sp. LY3-2]MCR6514490.1 SH3 domain-containing protein [Clostridium sp. LY3-2]
MKKKLTKSIFVALLAIGVAGPITAFSGDCIEANAIQTEVSYEQVVITRDGNGVNVRSSASINSRKIGALSEGSIARVDNYVNGWKHIVYPMRGWVCARYLHLLSND